MEDDEIDYEEEYDEQEMNSENIGFDNESNKKEIIEYEIIKNSEVIKKRDLIIHNFMECSCLNYDEAELVLMNFNWNYDNLVDKWFDETDKIKIDSHIEQSPESIKPSQIFSQKIIFQKMYVLFVSVKQKKTIL